MPTGSLPPNLDPEQENVNEDISVLRIFHTIPERDKEVSAEPLTGEDLFGTR
jgi:hypothetical protein